MKLVKKLLVATLTFAMTLTSVSPVFAEGEIDLKVDSKMPEYKPHEAVVLMKDSMSSKEVKAELSSAGVSVSVQSSEKIYGDNKTVALVESSLSTEKLVEKLNKDPDVIIAEPNYCYHSMGVTSDSYADRQRGYDAGSIDVERDKGFTGEGKVAGSEITIDGKSLKTISDTNSSVTVPNDGYTNKVVTITATNDNGTATKETVYIVEGKGTVKYTKYYVPGNRVSVKARANKGYYVASVSLNGKVKRYFKKSRTRKISVSNALTKNTKVKVVFKKKK